MNQRVTFTVYGEPKAQRRAGERVIPLARPVGGRKFIVQHYDRSAKEKKSLALSMQANRPEGGPMTGPVLLICRAFRMIPKATSKKKRADMIAGRILPDTVPDLDNILKLLKDAAKSILWLDDKQVTDEVIIKRYSDTPRVEYTVAEIDNGRLMYGLTAWLRDFAGLKSPGSMTLKWPGLTLRLSGDATDAQKHLEQDQDSTESRELAEREGET